MGVGVAGRAVFYMSQQGGTGATALRLRAKSMTAYEPQLHKHPPTECVQWEEKAGEAMEADAENNQPSCQCRGAGEDVSSLTHYLGLGT